MLLRELGAPVSQLQPYLPFDMHPATCVSNIRYVAEVGGTLAASPPLDIASAPDVDDTPSYEVLASWALACRPKPASATQSVAHGPGRVRRCRGLCHLAQRATVLDQGT